MKILLILLNACVCKLDDYIVVLKDKIQTYSDNDHFEKIQNYISSHTYASNTDKPKINYVYDKNILHGYEGKFNNDIVKFLKSQSEVKYVELDHVATMDYFINNKNATWNLDRISHQKLSDKDQREYKYHVDAGKNVLVYVLDTGVNINHIEFEGRAKFGTNIIDEDVKLDGNGHGTHVAGIIGGKTYGIARKTEIISVKVLNKNGMGKASTIIKGIEWSIKDVKSKQGYNAFIINMSLGCKSLFSLNEAVKNAFESGILIVSAAGNDNEDGCKQSPGSSKYSYTVGSTDIKDNKSSFSNYGKCVNLWAPGSSIKSSYIGPNNNEFKFSSGTSMAAPHVSGVAAYVASQMNQGNRPGNLRDYITMTSLRNVVKGLDKESENRFLYFNP